MKHNGYYLFTQNGKYYFYSIVTGVILSLSQEAYQCLKEYRENTDKPKYRSQIVDTFLQNGLLQDVEIDVYEAQTEFETAYLSFAPTYQCNFRCKYCFGEFGYKYKSEKRSFDQTNLTEMLNFFFYKAFPKAKHYRIDFVSGGEPLLGMKVIKETVAYIENYKKATGKNVSIWLCTNASLITDDIIDFFSAHNVALGISVDGRKEYNDKVRIDVNGNGTYDRIVNGIELVLNSSKSTTRLKNIWGLCTATNDNCDFVDMLLHMNQLGFQNVQIRLVRSNNPYDVRKILSQYARLSEFLLEFFEAGDLAYLKMILNDNDQYGKVLKRILSNQILLRRCYAGKNKITVCPDGSIYPCDSFVGLSHYCMGSIYEQDPKLWIYQKHSIDSVDECKICKLKYLCGGDCYYNSYMKNGCTDVPDKQFCMIQEFIIQQTIALCLNMQNKNMELYNVLLAHLKRKEDYAKLFG